MYVIVFVSDFAYLRAFGASSGILLGFTIIQEC